MIANALTAARLLLVLPVGMLIASEHPRAALFAAIAIVLAIATDLADGPVARRSGTASPLGGTFDHTTDFLFVVSGMTGGVARGVFPWILPALVVTAFVQYFIDSRWLHKGRGLHPTAQSPRVGGPGLHPTAQSPRVGGPGLHPTAQSPRVGGPGLHPTAQSPRVGGPGLRGSRLGRYNGILYFVPLCGDTLVRLGLPFLRPAVSFVCWLLVASTGLSIGQRAWALRQVRQTAPASPVEGTAGRSPR